MQIITDLLVRVNADQVNADQVQGTLVWYTGLCDTLHQVCNADALYYGVDAGRVMINQHVFCTSAVTENCD